MLTDGFCPANGENCEWTASCLTTIILLLREEDDLDEAADGVSVQDVMAPEASVVLQTSSNGDWWPAEPRIRDGRLFILCTAATAMIATLVNDSLVKPVCEIRVDGLTGSLCAVNLHTVSAQFCARTVIS